MKTVIEYAEYIRKADRVFGIDQRDEIVLFLSKNPKAGKKLEGFGGIRRLDWRDEADYGIYFHPGTNNLPLVVIAMFRKGEKMILDKIVEILIHSKTRS